MIGRNVNVSTERAEEISELKRITIEFAQKSIIYSNDFYKRNTTGLAMEELLADKADYRSLMRATKDKKKQAEYILYALY